MKNHWFISIKLTVATLILFGVVYPLIVTGIAWLTASNHGQGEIVAVNNKVYGFKIIGQSFTSDKYFNGRPSAVSYNAAATGGSNKGPSNPEYLAQVEQRINDFIQHNPTIKREDIPVDLVTASGGGLDPHISVKAALVQVDRIAAARNMDRTVIKKIIDDNTEGPLLGLFGPAGVNILKANLELDSLK